MILWTIILTIPFWIGLIAVCSGPRREDQVLGFGILCLSVSVAIKMVIDVVRKEKPPNGP